MKKGVVIGLIVLAVVIGYMATHKPMYIPLKDVTETAQDLGENKLATGTTSETKQDASETEALPPSTPSPAAPTESSAQSPAAVPESNPAPVSAITGVTGAVDIAHAMSERSLGREDAPVTVIEYASLTCPHCAHFATEILPKVKAQLIDTGRMRLIYRDFPLDKLALKAAEMARCAPKEKYFDLIEVIFRNQERWLKAASPEEALMQFGALAGMSDNLMKACMNSTELENALTNGLQEAQSKFSLQATPSFVFNYGAKVFSGAQDVTKFEEVLQSLSATPQK